MQSKQVSLDHVSSVKWTEAPTPENGQTHSKICWQFADQLFGSSVKLSDPGHFLKSQGKLFLSFPCTPFYIFFDT